mmetsp:Transcript_16381/g.24459  ORF Transcript_16381/g.24459 Transcript_16381/m.24459 type:complete len:156 (+) Transcript_16381:108-575(+)
MNVNPILIFVFNVTGEIMGVSSFRCNARKPQPTPTSRLNAGPAKTAVVAMFGSPFFAKARLLDKSPIELPIANTVMPRMPGGIRRNVPKNCSNSTRALPMLSIQVAAIKNPYSDRGMQAISGILFSSAYRRIANATINATSMNEAAETVKKSFSR